MGQVVNFRLVKNSDTGQPELWTFTSKPLDLRPQIPEPRVLTLSSLNPMAVTLNAEPGTVNQVSPKALDSVSSGMRRPLNQRSATSTIPSSMEGQTIASSAHQDLQPPPPPEWLSLSTFFRLLRIDYASNIGEGNHKSQPSAP